MTAKDLLMLFARSMPMLNSSSHRSPPPPTPTEDARCFRRLPIQATPRV